MVRALGATRFLAAGRPMRFVLLYESLSESRAKIPVHYPAHAARCEEFHDARSLVAIGVFTDADDDGPRSMNVFKTRAAAEEFVAGDPFVVNGIVSRWSLPEWNEVFLDR